MARKWQGIGDGISLDGGGGGGSTAPVGGGGLRRRWLPSASMALGLRRRTTVAPCARRRVVPSRGCPRDVVEAAASIGAALEAARGGGSVGVGGLGLVARRRALGVAMEDDGGFR